MQQEGEDHLHIHNLEVLYIHKKLQHDLTPQIKQHFLETISSRDKHKIVRFWRKLLIKQSFDEELVMTTEVVSEIEAHEKQSQLVDIHWQQVVHIAQFMKTTRQLSHIVPLIHTLLFVHKVPTIAIQEVLFKTLIELFEFLPSDELRNKTCEILVALLRQNTSWLQWANTPYYFLQYLLHLLNQEQDPARVQSRFQDIKQLYIVSGSQEHLFYQNDFRLLVDVLLRNIQNYNNEKQLITLVETYLVLSICPYLKVDHQYYRLEEILMALGEIGGSETLQAYTQELNSLYQEKL